MKSMNKYLSVFVLLFIVFSCKNPANTDISNTEGHGFTIVNNSESIFFALHVVPAYSKTWGNDLLGKKVISKGEEFFVEIKNDESETYHIHAKTLVEGEYYTLKNISKNQKKVLITKDHFHKSQTPTDPQTPIDPPTPITPPDAEFVLNPILIAYNYPIYILLTGTDNRNNTVKCEITASSQSTVVVNGYTTSTNISIENIYSPNTKKTFEISNYYIKYPQGVSSESITIDNALYSGSGNIIPYTAKIGQSGSFGHFIDAHRNSVTGTWELTNAGNNTATLTEKIRINDSWGSAISLRESVCKIDTNGKRLSIYLKIVDLSKDYSATLGSK